MGISQGRNHNGTPLADTPDYRYVEDLARSRPLSTPTDYTNQSGRYNGDDSFSRTRYHGSPVGVSYAGSLVYDDAHYDEQVVDPSNYSLYGSL